ncbi:MAG: hypothetical protein M0006_04370 [Magnetospirillum sp.]|nr:hypothetical protein [Magnetospirillum sp.]
MNAADRVREDLEKASSLVTTARRLLATGTMVDLSALEGKVRQVCSTVSGMERDQGRPLAQAMEALIADLDRLADAIRERSEPLAERLGPLQSS